MTNPILAALSAGSVVMAAFGAASDSPELLAGSTVGLQAVGLWFLVSLRKDVDALKTRLDACELGADCPKHPARRRHTHPS